MAVGRTFVCFAFVTSLVFIWITPNVRAQRLLKGACSKIEQRLRDRGLAFKRVSNASKSHNKLLARYIRRHKKRLRKINRKRRRLERARRQMRRLQWRYAWETDEEQKAWIKYRMERKRRQIEKRWYRWDGERKSIPLITTLEYESRYLKNKQGAFRTVLALLSQQIARLARDLDRCREDQRTRFELERKKLPELPE